MGVDVEVVGEMFDGFVRTSAPDVEVLDFCNLAWDDAQCSQVLRMLQRFKKCSVLRLDRNHATDGFAREVATIVAANDTLKLLLLADNQITHVGVAALAAA